MIGFIILLILYIISVRSDWFLRKARKSYNTEIIDKIEELTDLESKYTTILLIIWILFAFALQLCKIDYTGINGFFFSSSLIVTFIIAYIILSLKFLHENIPPPYIKKFILFKLLRIVFMVAIFWYLIGNNVIK
jgi:hypothetical protein